MHLDDELLQRALHGELDDPQGVEAHLAACADCRARLDAAQQDEAQIFGLLRRLDHAAPDTAAATVVARAVRGRGRLRWAAGVLLTLSVGGVAYAAPGSPLPALVRRMAAWLRPRPPQPPQPPQEPGAGIAVLPGARFTIVFATPPASGAVTVSLVEGPNIVVRRLDGTASFTSDADRLTIAAADAAARYEIELPRAAPWIEVLVGSRRLLLKDGARVATAAVADTTGRYILPLGP